MNMDILRESAFTGSAVSLGAYFLSVQIRKRWNIAIFNPLLIAIILTIIFLMVCRIDYDAYYEGARYISYLLTPATVCLAIPLYEQFAILKGNWKAIVLGIASGVLTSMLTILSAALLFHFTHEEYVTFLPKSITTAIGMSLSQEHGGYVSLTVAIIIITGITGNVCAETILRLFHITEPVARGVAIGTASHAIGTARAMEMGEIEGAISSLSVVIAGMLTVASASVFAGLL